MIVLLALAGAVLQARDTFDTTSESLRALSQPAPSRDQRELGAVIDPRLGQPMLALRGTMSPPGTLRLNVSPPRGRIESMRSAMLHTASSSPPPRHT